MKQLILLLTFILAFLCIGCDNEPVEFEIVSGEVPISGDPATPDPEPTNPEPEPGNPTNGNSIQLANYSYQKIATESGNDTTFTTDFNINSQNQFLSQETSLMLLGTTVNATASIIRDQNTRVIGAITRVDGNIINSATVTYNIGKIATISYEDLEDPTENYTFSFTHLNNEVTRVKEGTVFSTKFTFDDENRLIKRETMESGMVVKTENINYDSNGNLVSSVITGQDANSFTYGHDSNVNPLHITMNDLYKFLTFYDEYDEQYEHWHAILFSSNNVISVQTNQGISNLNIEYDDSNRIISRNGNLYSSLPNIPNDVNININETFQYIN